jgi:hypothetical protein
VKFRICLYQDPTLGICAAWCLRLSKSVSYTLIYSSYCLNCWNSLCILFLQLQILVQQNSVNLTCRRPDRHQIIEYSGLSDSTYTDLSSYR